MRILVVSATFPPMRSGGADYAFRLCQRLAESGHHVEVLTSCIDGLDPDPRLRIHPVMRNWSWRDLPRLIRVARRCRPDVLNLHFTGVIYDEHPMITFLPTILKRLVPGLRFVTHIEYPGGARLELLSYAGRQCYRAAVSWAGPTGVDPVFGTLLRDSDEIIILSDAHRKILAPHSPSAADRCVFIPPPPLMRMSAEGDDSRRRGREILQVSDDEFVMAYLGYIYPFKGIETLLAAFQLVAKQTPNTRLVIVGGSNEVMLNSLNRPRYVEELKELSERLGVADRVIWTGYYPTESDVGSLYLRSADICVLPFDNGVFLNNSSFTAVIAHGLPVVTTQAEVVEPAIVDGKNVLLCPPLEPKCLALAIQKLMTDADLRQQLCEGAQAMAIELFSWDSVLKRTIEVFKPSSEANG